MMTKQKVEGQEKVSKAKRKKPGNTRNTRKKPADKVAADTPVDVMKSNEWVPHAKQIAIARLLVNPENRGTKEQKAKDAGITYKTLWVWMQDPNFVAYLNSLINQYTDAETAEVWKALIRKAKMGDVSAIKLFFEMKGMYKEQKKVEHTGEGGGPIDTELRIVIDYGDGGDDG
ncbi:putative insertion element HTH domain-containing protein [Anaerospora hongkongensis]|uniref:Putative insertion element HTH domain-containing protein n=2 Tax=Anaerospora hongkongensis TaxID=244830 RepID=A0A4R1Q3A3_9FIRM|nr:putative insertion element HTH domain-containing protein [Anaerospora hongkongensis]